MSGESSVTWQKLTVIVAVLGVAMPATVRYCWNVVFPADYLLFETTHTTKFEGFQVGSIFAFNGGSDLQRDVVLFLPSDAAPAQGTVVSVSPPSRAALRHILDAQPEVPISQYKREAVYQIPLGTIEPDEGVEVTLVFKDERDNLSFRRLDLSDARVESSSVSAIEANGPRAVEFHDHPHAVYMSIAPFLLAFVAALVGLLMVANAIHGLFFDSPQKKMARYWREMDQLQEQIDKNRRYE